MRNFSWLIEGVIAGMGRPGGYGSDGHPDLERDLKKLRRMGLGGIVSLTETPLSTPSIDRLDFSYLHVPIDDMGIPYTSEIDRFVVFVENVKKSGKGVVVHCGAGIGRTGMMLACYLVSQGESTQSAIETVRRARPGSIETSDQELAIYDYECHRRTACAQ